MRTIWSPSQCVFVCLYGIAVTFSELVLELDRLEESGAWGRVSENQDDEFTTNSNKEVENEETLSKKNEENSYDEEYDEENYEITEDGRIDYHSNLYHHHMNIKIL